MKLKVPFPRDRFAESAVAILAILVSVIKAGNPPLLKDLQTLQGGSVGITFERFVMNG